MTTQAVKHDKFDQATYGEARDSYPRLAGAPTGPDAAKLPQAEPLVRDLFYSFYRRAPQLEERDALDAPYRVNHEIMEQVTGTQEWADVRSHGTPGDPLTSAIAAAGVAGTVFATLPDDTKRKMTRQAAAEAAARMLFEQADTLDELAQERDAPQLAARAEKERKAAAKKQATADAIGQELAAGAEERADQVRRAARQALQRAGEDVARANAALRAFGGEGIGHGPGDGGGGDVPAADKLALAQRMMAQPNLLALAEMAGRLMRIAFAVQQARIDHAPDEVTSIETGNDLAHLLPSELALLANGEELEDLFFLRYAERALLQYELTGREKLGRGPIIVAVDESSSMAAALRDGTRKDVWSKAVTLALLAIARKQGRDFAVLHFSSAHQIEDKHFPRGKASLLETVEIAEHFFGGGTDYDEWMETAVAYAGESRFDKADVILVSDGIAAVSPATAARWNHARGERGMRAYAVMLCDHPMYERQAHATLGPITDATFALTDLTGEREALQTLFGV